MNTITKKLINSKLAQFLLASRLFFQFLLKRSTVIFLYHEVADNPSRFYAEYDLNVTPLNFENQIQTIKKNFNLITPPQLLEENYKTPAALITFDDGTAGYFENALPILARHNCPSLIFLNMAPIEGDIFYSGLVIYLCNYHDGFKKFLKEKHQDALRESHFLHVRPQWIEKFLAENNREEIYDRAKEYYGALATPNHLNKYHSNSLVYFGNHLYRHYNCTSCGEAELKQQYEKNRLALRKYPNSIDFFSYPFGQKNTCYNETTNTILNQLGAKALFAAQPDSFKSSGNFFYRLPINNSIESEAQLKAYLCLKRYKQIFCVGWSPTAKAVVPSK